MSKFVFINTVAKALGISTSAAYTRVGLKRPLDRILACEVSRLVFATCEAKGGEVVINNQGQGAAFEDEEVVRRGAAGSQGTRC